MRYWCRCAAAIVDQDGFERPIGRVDSALFDLTHDVHASEHAPDDDVLAVEVRRCAGRDEELRAVHILARARHRHDPWCIMPPLKVLIVELPAVDALTTKAVARDNIACLDHHASDNAVEGDTTVVQRHIGQLTQPLFARAEASEILRGYGHLPSTQLNDDAPDNAPAHRHTEPARR